LSAVPGRQRLHFLRAAWRQVRRIQVHFLLPDCIFQLRRQLLLLLLPSWGGGEFDPAGGDCKGDVEKCPLKVSHITNLEWKNDLFWYQKPKGFGLGCSMCREIKESGSEKKKKKVLEAEERYQLKLLETKAKM